MNVSRSFLIIGSIYLPVGILIGLFMSGSGDHALTPAHAHINLLGFTLMTLFGLTYHVFPAMGASRLAQVHFWLHQVFVLVLMIMLVMLQLGKIVEAQMFPVAPIAIVGVLIGVLCFLANLISNAR